MGMLYDKPVWQLAMDAAEQLPEPWRVNEIVQWFAAGYPKVKQKTVKMHLIAMTANDRNRRHHAHLRRRQGFFFKTSTGVLERYDPVRHGRFNEFGEPIADQPAELEAVEIEYVGSQHNDVVSTPSEATMEFALELYLEEFLLSNWAQVDWGRPLRVYKGDEGHQLSTSIGRLDFLCEDVATGAFVVVELKRGRPSDRVIGQLARYMGWVRHNLATKGQGVEGIIVAQEVDDQLRYAADAVPGVTLLEYRIDFTLESVALDPRRQD